MNWKETLEGLKLEKSIVGTSSYNKAIDECISALEKMELSEKEVERCFLMHGDREVNAIDVLEKLKFWSSEGRGE